MSKDVFDEQIRDQNTYQSAAIGSDITEGVFQISNTLDQAMDYEFFGTYNGDSDFSDAVSLGTGTVNSGENVRKALSEPWDKVQFETSTNGTTDPTSGRLLVKYHTED